MINRYLTKCNICGGKVIYTGISRVYRKKYGSGKCYLCLRCGAYVGTLVPHSREALGLLVNSEMRTLIMQCHYLFAQRWKKGKK